MKKILIILVFLILILALGFYIKSNTSSQNSVLGDDIRLINYTNGNGALVVDFLLNQDQRAKLSLAIDINQDGNFSEDEWLVKGMMVLPRQETKSKVYFELPDNFIGQQHILVELNEERADKNIEVELQDLSGLMDLDSVTDPEESMKGFGINYALAEGDIIEITQDNVPDINQKPGECAPTAAANGLTSLINQHGQTAQDPSEMIEELKDLMHWNKENGVQPDNFVEGKNKWALEHGLPIRTTKVGDKDGITTVDEIRNALEQGASVELRMKFGDASGKSVGGHMVTVTGIHQGEGQTYLDLNDPYTPSEEGTETVEIRSNQMTNYGPWPGLTVLSWGFIQIWETPQNSGTSLEPMTDTEVEGLIGEFGDRPAEASIESSFAHVKPGEYSEVYAAVSVAPGTEVCLSLSGPSVADSGTKVITADSNGQAYFTWKITAYGTYNISGACGDVDVSSQVVVN